MTNSEWPVASSGGTSLRVRADIESLKPRSDLTYRTLDGLTVNSADVFQSLFTGSILRNTSWDHVRFERSDLDGLRAERSTFTGCNFETCDVRSSQFAGCRFDSCSFEGVLVDDCEFADCELINCDFSHASISGTRFHRSKITSCSFSPGSFLHNRLYSCVISDTSLGDCTLLYVIMRGCTFNRVKINAESLGMILGLTREQLGHLDLIYLGQDQVVPSGADVVPLIVSEYQRRRWYIGLLVHDLNFGLTSRLEAFRRYFSRAHSNFMEIGFVKGDESRFLMDVMDDLDARASLPFFSVIEARDWCESLRVNLPSASTRTSDEALRLTVGRLSLLNQRMLAALEEGLSEVSEASTQAEVELRITFERKPEVAVCYLLNALTAEGHPQSVLMRVEQGSYVEVIMTTLFSVAALRTFLFLLNGIVIQLTELRHRVNVLTRSQPPKAYRDLALSPKQIASPAVSSMLQMALQVVRSHSMVKEQNLGGYGADNVHRLEYSALPGDRGALNAIQSKT